MQALYILTNDSNTLRSTSRSYGIAIISPFAHPPALSPSREVATYLNTHVAHLLALSQLHRVSTRVKSIPLTGQSIIIMESNSHIFNPDLSTEQREENKQFYLQWPEYERLNTQQSSQYSNSAKEEAQRKDSQAVQERSLKQGNAEQEICTENSSVSQANSTQFQAIAAKNEASLSTCPTAHVLSSMRASWSP